MAHLILFLACILSVEALIRLNLLTLLDLMVGVIRKVTHVIPNDKISDNWKEIVIPAYALRIMQYSLQILLILLLILSFFLISELFYNNFFQVALSFAGIIESVFFAFGYTYLRKLFIK
jgi:hypothetical protein